MGIIFINSLLFIVISEENLLITLGIHAYLIWHMLPFFACFYTKHLQLQAYFLLLDDIMDGSHTRRGHPCWFRLPKVFLSFLLLFFFSSHCSFFLLCSLISWCLTSTFFVNIYDGAKILASSFQRDCKGYLTDLFGNICYCFISWNKNKHTSSVLKDLQSLSNFTSLESNLIVQNGDTGMLFVHRIMVI